MPRAQDGLFDRDSFAGFGPSRFRPAGDVPSGHGVRGKSARTLLNGVQSHAPKHPGVYGMLDARGRVIYVGKAKALRVRLLSYFRTKSRDPKAGKIVKNTRVLVWEETADEFSALLRELELIRRFRPRFNVIGQPGPRRYLYLCIGKSPAPYAYLTRDPTSKDLACYGPLLGRETLEEAVRRLNDYFRLRDCPRTVKMAFADQPELFPADRVRCLRYDIGSCLAPCAGECSRKTYSANVRAAKAFLDGRDATVLKDLARRMTAASAEMKYEQATALRDRLQLLTRLDERLTFLRNARSSGSFIYPLTGPNGLTMWYLIHHGEVRAAVREPQNDDERIEAASLIETTFAEPGAVGVTDHTVDSVLLVSAWFRKYAEEKAKLRAYAGRQAAQKLVIV